MTHNPLTIRSRFESGAPDRYLAFFEAVREILHCETTCKTYKLQKIGILLGAAESGQERWAELHNAWHMGSDSDHRARS